MSLLRDLNKKSRELTNTLRNTRQGIDEVRRTQNEVRRTKDDLGKAKQGMQDMIPNKTQAEGATKSTCACGVVFESKFCPECGAKAYEPPKCANCNITVTSKFCPECGQPVAPQG